MPTSDVLDEKLRSAEQAGIASAPGPVPAEAENLQEVQRAKEMIELMQQQYERVGAMVDVLAATVQQGGMAIRAEVTMSHSAAEQLFGNPNELRSSREFAEVTRVRRMAFWSATSFWNDARARLIRKLDESDPPSGSSTLPSWMQEVLRLDESGASDTALDALLDRVDELLSSSDFQMVDDLIAAMPLEGPSLTLMMGLLSISRPAAQHLPSRARFFDRVYRLCKAMRRDAEALLGGLR